MHPPHSSIALTNDAVLSVEWLPFADDLFYKVADHSLPVVRMNQFAPAFNRAVVVLVDSKDLIHDSGTRPHACLDIRDVASQSGDSLRLLEPLLALTQCMFGLHVRRLIASHAE